IPLAKMAVAESGMGIIEDKVIKNHFASEYIYNAYKDEKTCGVKTLLVSIGDNVKKDQLLGVIDPDQAENQIKEVEATLMELNA
ncbi:biotin/lipoyl-binding protein, partial [Salmonella enterica subsp. enterica serovar Montevideo]|nr:biotin/lipoyl-binding protein [Salmonella enterica subsp. enterica serovar Montevideo]